MNKLLKKTSLRPLIFHELPALAAADVIAEFFFKFGSFTLELLAFFGTWVAIRWLINKPTP